MAIAGRRVVGAPLQGFLRYGHGSLASVIQDYDKGQRGGCGGRRCYAPADLRGQQGAYSGGGFAQQAADGHCLQQGYRRQGDFDAGQARRRQPQKRAPKAAPFRPGSLAGEQFADFCCQAHPVRPALIIPPSPTARWISQPDKRIFSIRAGIGFPALPRDANTTMPANLVRSGLSGLIACEELSRRLCRLFRAEGAAPDG